MIFRQFYNADGTWSGGGDDDSKKYPQGPIFRISDKNSMIQNVNLIHDRMTSTTDDEFHSIQLPRLARMRDYMVSHLSLYPVMDRLVSIMIDAPFCWTVDVQQVIVKFNHDYEKAEMLAKKMERYMKRNGWVNSATSFFFDYVSGDVHRSTLEQFPECHLDIYDAEKIQSMLEVTNFFLLYYI